MPRPYPRLRGAAVTLLAAAAAALPLTALTAAPAAAQAADPAVEWSNYEKITLTKNVGEPVDLAVLPDRRVLHTARNGDVRLTDPATGVTRVVNSLPVYANSEDGLQTIAIDPEFAENRWVYVYYAPRTMTAPYPETTPAGSAPNSLPAGADESYWDQWKGYNQLSRFKWTGDALDLGTEQVILKVEVQRGQCCHVAGDIDWDADGNLYLSTGDNTPAGTPGANGYAPNNDAPGMNPGFDARRGSGNTNDLRGKILRITVAEDGSYTVPEGNLFAPGTTGTRPEIYVMGLRNPFRIDVDPASGAVMWGDYGPDAGTANPQRGPMGYVEWQSTTRAINAGWPYCHGPNANYNNWDFATATPREWFDCTQPRNTSRWNTGLTDLPPATAPQLYYGDQDSHQPWPELTAFGAGTGQGPMGGPLYRFDAENPSPTKFPSHWDGKAFFGEFSQDYVAAFTIPDPDGDVTAIEDVLPNAALTTLAQPLWDNPMDLEFGPDGSLYVLDYGDGFFRQNPDSGLYRVDYAEGNKTPTARISATPTSGHSPLEVSFSGAESSDPEGSALTYEWDFDGDGTFDATGVQAQHTYVDNGQFAARLRVTDPSGKVGLSSVEITVGNTAPTVEISVPDGGFFDWGDAIPYEVTVTDPEDGTSIVCSRVSWTFGLGHNQHAHPVNSGTGCSGGVPTPADAGHGETENVFGVLGVSYRDGGANGVPGATGSTQVVLNPKLLEAEHADDSSGTEVTDDGSASGLRAVTSLDAGDWLAYDPVNLTGIGGLAVRASGEGTLSLRWNSPGAEPFATAAIPAGTGWQHVNLALGAPPQGTGTLYVTSSGGVVLDSLTFAGDGVADVTPPAVSATLNPAQPNGENGWYRTGNVTLAVTATDNGTVSSRQYSLNGGATWTNTNNQGVATISAEGDHTVLYRAIDNGGNVSEPGQVGVRIDRTEPAVTLGGVEQTAYGDSATITPAFSATDGLSGVGSVSATLDGAPVTSGAEIGLWRLPLGEHTLVVTAKDRAGNTASTSVTFSTGTSFADVSALLGRFTAEGSVTKASAVTLDRQLSSAQRHAEAGRIADAADALQRFAAQAADPKRVVTAEAREVLVRDAEALIAALSAPAG
ncbi:PQQ-dependent sugar dehydrogenase [Prauserella muralis]|uniref:Glycosyl hydrolase n=1 Tax=Prauserella muralis TaxID=588067 RepID=A0A2V4B130_9PSEU|nr:PQQ-dependent sugar dehydrogenase [Prauserella muralis]PXY27727.1 glycosyl hydrolase [Prauserella muralis]TWE22525.1 glucose/arabinose dehydrogenase [Prauserella muralis]